MWTFAALMIWGMVVSGIAVNTVAIMRGMAREKREHLLANVMGVWLAMDAAGIFVVLYRTIY